jgi:putative spermidine/putrescine transport system ATP-binding protein
MTAQGIVPARQGTPSASPAHGIALRDISHRYGDATALDAISLDIAPGELIALLGPSGCGKTTLLRIIAGFVRQTLGQVCIDGRPIDTVDAGKREIGIVFQNYALFPHLSVVENVAYGPLARRTPRKRALEIATDMLERVQMNAFSARLPRELSGGQQQRVALARALAISPRIMLLDEPFSALDKALRLDMQSEVKTLLKGAGVTSLMVTHDQEEALSMADRIVVLNKGRIEQIGGPVEIYDSPATLFVGGFIGTMNLLPGRASELDGGVAGISLASGELVRCPAATGHRADTPLLLGVRPENLRFADEGVLCGHVSQVLPLGPTDVVEVTTASGSCLRVASSRSSSHATVSLGQRVGLDIVDTRRCAVFLP